LLALHDSLFNVFASIIHIGGCSSILNLRTRHTVVKGTHLSQDKDYKKNLMVFKHTVLVSGRGKKREREKKKKKQQINTPYPWYFLTRQKGRR